MDNASYITNVQYTKQGGTYSAMLVSDYGDIYQNYTSYDNETNKATGVSPSFETNPPTVNIAIFNSKKISGDNSNGEVYPNNVVWTVLGQTLTFDTNGISTNNFNGETGHFKRITANAGTKTRAGLKIVKNIVVAAQATPFSIEALATVANGKGSTKVTASVSVPIKKVSTSATVVRISATNGGIIMDVDGKRETTLTANVDVSEDAGVDVNGLTYVWQAMNPDTGAFENLAGSTGKTLKVGLAMVDQSRLFKVVVSNAKGETIGSDVQAVYDQSDPLNVIPNPTPSDETIREGDASASKVTWNPELYRGDIKVDDSKVKWKFVPIDAVNATLFPNPITDKSQFVITEEQIADAGGIQVIISATVTE